MRRDEALARLKAAEPAIRSLGASALYLYGSHARGDARHVFTMRKTNDREKKKYGAQIEARR